MKNKIFTILVFTLIIGVAFILFCSKEADTLGTESDTSYAMKLLSKMNFKSLTRAAYNNSQEALARIKILAENGNVKAQYLLGEFYIRENPSEAVKWYGKALDQKDLKTLSLYRLDTILNNYKYLNVHDNVLECLKRNDDIFSVKRILGFFYANGDYPDEETSEKYFNSLMESANNGNSEAQHQLGIAYKEGNGVALESNYEKALFWLKKAAEQNNPEALFDLGRIYDRGDCGVTENHIEAFNWYLKAAQQENPNAMTTLAYIYEKGEVISQDKHEAAQWRLKSIEHGEDSMYTLYSNSLKGDNESRSALLELAEKGYDEAQNYLGDIHYIDKNYNEAGKWYLKAYKLGNTDCLTSIESLTELGIPEAIEITRELAEFGSKHAQAILGLVYSRGSGVKQDFNEALKWLQRSAAQNYELGQYLLGLMYYHGHGVKQDYVEAARLIHRAENKGLIAAMQAMRDVNLLYGAGIMCRDGIDVKQDRANASRLFHKAAGENGNTEANFILGDMYEHGKDEKQNYTKAINYYCYAAKKGHQESLFRIQTLAEKGNVYAMYNLGIMCSSNEESYNEALKWFDMAAKKGYLDAIKMIALFADSDRKAFNFLKTYAEQGNTQAQLDLANIYYGGGSEFLDIEPNIKEAVIWFRKSAQQGNTIAQYKLGMIYLKGEGLEKNKDMAVKLLLQSANKGYKPARNQLAELGIYPEAQHEEARSSSKFNANGYISGNNVNLRASPSTKARIITKCNNAQLINIGQKRGNWYFIKTSNGEEGWIFKKYIKLK